MWITLVIIIWYLIFPRLLLHTMFYSIYCSSDFSLFLFREIKNVASSLTLIAQLYSRYIAFEMEDTAAHFHIIHWHWLIFFSHMLYFHIISEAMNVGKKTRSSIQWKYVKIAFANVFFSAIKRNIMS